jgi:hypothetical protein
VKKNIVKKKLNGENFFQTFPQRNDLPKGNHAMNKRKSPLAMGVFELTWIVAGGHYQPAVLSPGDGCKSQQRLYKCCF